MASDVESAAEDVAEETAENVDGIRDVEVDVTAEDAEDDVGRVFHCRNPASAGGR